MPQLVDRMGRPISSSQYKKADPPKLGAIGHWSEHDIQYMNLPGGGVLQFDLSRLTLQDYRSMRDHYQVNANLTVLMFMLHQIDWHIKSENKQQAEFIEGNLRETWTRLVRALSQADWAGYAPNVLEYENNPQNGRTELNKIKDLIPEDCSPHWKVVDGWAPADRPPPRVKIFDGMRVRGMSWPIPVTNTFWYPLLMENGNYYGRKLLRPAFPSWFFSILIHLFSNRYFERFGEPVPIGRAPNDETVSVNGTTMDSREAMELMLMQLRSRSVVVLPSDRQPIPSGHSGVPPYEYDIEYLESQMRGADFERYMQRLDEEISLSLFTPILLLRTADVGSYNLGVGHMQLFMWMLNALCGDRKEYIDRYIVRPLKDYNFGPNAPKAEWVYKPLGKQNVETIRAIITALVGAGSIKPDITELGDIAGLTLKEVKQLTQPDPANDPGQDPNAPDGNKTGGGSGKRGVGSPRATQKDISARIAEQVTSAFRKGTFGSGFSPSLGYRRQFAEALRESGFAFPENVTDQFYSTMNTWLTDAISAGTAAFATPEEFMQIFDRVIAAEVDELVDAS